MALSQQQMDAMIANDQKFADLVKAHGVPAAVVDCTQGGHDGEVCMEGNCVKGKKLIMKCNSVNGCTDYEVIAC